MTDIQQLIKDLHQVYEVGKHHVRHARAVGYWEPEPWMGFLSKPEAYSTNFIGAMAFGLHENPAAFRKYLSVYGPAKNIIWKQVQQKFPELTDEVLDKLELLWIAGWNTPEDILECLEEILK